MPYASEVVTFRYAGFDIDESTNTVVCSYVANGVSFDERVTIDGADWNQPGVEAAAALVALLAGVSYYKAFAEPVIDLGTLPIADASKPFVFDYFVDGLGEFAFVNDMDLTGVSIVGGAEPNPAAMPPRSGAPLVPFGGGIDSIVAVEWVKQVTDDAALFIVSRAGDHFDAIENAAKVTSLPIQRASRELDSKILRSRELGYLNGHVPVTGVLSAIAVLTAITTGYGEVVMSNEHSASMGNVVHRGREVNHQYSKSLRFEGGFRELLRSSIGDAAPDYFSLLRPFSALWIAERFAQLTDYLPVFRSCNRAFHIDPPARLDHWCGHCDKCAFVDLVLSPFLSAVALDEVFSRAGEPLRNMEMLTPFRTLIGTNELAKPFECVGDPSECQLAVQLASARSDRADSPVLTALAGEVAAADVAAHGGVMGTHFIPDRYLAAIGLR